MVPLRYNLRSLMVRKTTTLATCLGIALVVAALCASAMLSNGIERTMRSSGSDSVAIVLRKGSDNELGSTLEDAQVALIAASPQVKLESGAPLKAAEVIVVVAAEKIGATGVSNLQLRGVEADVLRFRPSVKITSGRAPRPGTDEAMIGQRIRGHFVGVDLGKSFEVKKNRSLTVVGVFEDSGSSYESEIWLDIDTLRTSFGREGARSSVRVQLRDRDAFEGFKNGIENDKRLGLMALRERDYYERQAEGTALFVKVLGTVITVFFSIGATIGAAITMYAAVANRRREVGILRALGFSSRSILASFVFESVALSMIGGGAGVLMALLLSGVKFSMMNMASWSEIVFSLDATPSVVVSGLAFSLFMGLIGGFLPALRASQVSPIAAMRG